MERTSVTGGNREVAMSQEQETEKQVKEVAKVVEQVKAQRERESASNEALRRARKAIAVREQFIPKQVVPCHGVPVSF